VVLLIRDGLQPVGFARRVVGGDSHVRHFGVGRRAVPVFDARSDLDDVSFPDELDGVAALLVVAGPCALVSCGILINKSARARKREVPNGRVCMVGSESSCVLGMATEPMHALSELELSPDGA